MGMGSYHTETPPYLSLEKCNTVLDILRPVTIREIAMILLSVSESCTL